MPDSSEQGRRWTLHRISSQTGRNPESGGWTLRPRYDQHSRIEESIQVMPVAEHDAVVRELRAELQTARSEEWRLRVENTYMKDESPAVAAENVRVGERASRAEHARGQVVESDELAAAATRVLATAQRERHNLSSVHTSAVDALRSTLDRASASQPANEESSDE